LHNQLIYSRLVSAGRRLNRISFTKSVQMILGSFLDKILKSLVLTKMGIETYGVTRKQRWRYKSDKNVEIWDDDSMRSFAPCDWTKTCMSSAHFKGLSKSVFL
jgi:hypothetical protein